MARMTPEQRREAIVGAALQVLLRKGIAATTVRDVAHEMGSSSGLVHHYFASMDDLLAAAFDRAAGQDLDVTRRVMDDGDSPLDRIRLFFTSYARGDQDWAFQLWLDAWAEAARRPALQATSRRLNLAWQRLLADAVRDAVAAGLVVCEDPDATAWRILSLLDGLSLQVVAHRVTEVDAAQVIAWSAAAAESELGLPRGALSRPDAQTWPAKAPRPPAASSRESRRTTR